MTNIDEQINQLRMELRRGIVVLAVLSQMDTARYGYSLIQRLAEQGLDIEEGTLYPLLRRLEKQGLLESEWEVGEARPRKYYKISPMGRDVLTTLSVEWAATVEMMRRIWGENIMSELIERYVHQVGRYLPPKERTDIEAELRSQIEDKLDDRYADTPTQEQVAAVLAELGYPYVIAASYSTERYLIGPMLYPYLMMVLRRGLLIVPTIVVFLNVFGALTASQPNDVFNVVIETVFAVVQATLIFFAVVVLFFAILQHTYMERDQADEVFNPLELPEVDDPAVVDRFETIFGVVAGTLAALLFLYFLRVGGLTLRFDLNNPGDVIPSPAGWMLALILIIAGQVIMTLLAMREKRWSVGTWLGQTVLEIVGAIALYFAVTAPIFGRIVADNPNLANIVFINKGAEIFAVGYAVITLVSKGSKLVRLWSYRSGDTAPFTTQPDG